MTRTRCERMRERLLAGSTFPPSVEGHLASCTDCRRFAERAAAVRRALREHHGGVEPDAGFAGRVLARLPDRPSDLLGRAALQLLPVTLALALLMGWMALQSSPQPTTTMETEAASSQDLLLWALDVSGNGS